MVKFRGLFNAKGLGAQQGLHLFGGAEVALQLDI